MTRLWSSPDQTSFEWDSSDWPGRLEFEDANTVSAAALASVLSDVDIETSSVERSKLADAVVSTSDGVEFTQTDEDSIIVLANSDAASSVADTSSVEQSNRVSSVASPAISVEESSVVEIVISTSASSNSQLSDTATLSESSTVPPAAFSDTFAADSASEALISNEQTAVNVPLLSSDESTVALVQAEVLSENTTPSIADILTTVGEESILSVSGTTIVNSLSLTTARESLSIESEATAVSSDIAGSNEQATAIRRGDDTASATATPSLGQEQTLAEEQAEETTVVAVSEETFEILDIIERSETTEISLDTLDSVNELTIQSKRVASVANNLLGEELLTNDSIDFEDIGDETNIVVLDASRNEVIIE